MIDLGTIIEVLQMDAVAARHKEPYFRYAHAFLGSFFCRLTIHPLVFRPQSFIMWVYMLTASPTSQESSPHSLPSMWQALQQSLESYIATLRPRAVHPPSSFMHSFVSCLTSLLRRFGQVGKRDETEEGKHNEKKRKKKIAH